MRKLYKSRERELLVTKVHEIIKNDPEVIKLNDERYSRIKEIEDEYDRKIRKIRNRYWKEYGLL